jgi:hypothetical protein
MVHSWAVRYTKHAVLCTSTRSYTQQATETPGQSMFQAQQKHGVRTWNLHLLPKPAAALSSFARCACTGLRVMPCAVQPHLLLMCLLLPPMPQPTSTICATAMQRVMQNSCMDHDALNVDCRFTKLQKGLLYPLCMSDTVGVSSRE